MTKLLVTLGLAVLTLACAHQKKGAAKAESADAVDVQKSLEEAFEDIRGDDEQREKAHVALAQVFTLYDDLHEDERKALVQSDADKAYRAWPHERVLASSLLAALDAKKGRCELALPVVKDALRWDGFWHQSGHADTALPALIGIYCANRLSQKHSVNQQVHSRASYQSEIEFYEIELENALIASALNDAADTKNLGKDVLAAAHRSALQLSAEAKGGLRLVFSGRGQERPNVFHCDEKSLIIDVENEAADAVSDEDEKSTFFFPLWSTSSQQAHTRVRRFEKTLKVRELVRMPIELAAVFLLPKEVRGAKELAQKGASTGLEQGANLIDTRRDERQVKSIFAEVWWRSETSIELPAAPRVLRNETVRKALQKKSDSPTPESAKDEQPSKVSTQTSSHRPQSGMGSVGMVEGS